ncbi:MAG TPA: serine/threonine-protein kinase [Vicinamibacterales bacterium]|nr:serine/threonine-protein kinase [Vicinamibacterales bacterium]
MSAVSLPGVQPLRVGQRFGLYRIDGVLGMGGMGIVYRAHDRKLRRAVAIKLVDRSNAAARRSLLQEARLAASLNHPAICAVHEVGCLRDQPYVVMEHVVGLPLSLMLRGDEGIGIESMLHYTIQIVDAIAHAHGRDVVHCDLKSVNIMVTPAGSVKILDFGLANRQPVELDATAGDTTRSEMPSGAGTVPYMAPEVLRGRRADRRSDVWAMGILMYEMAAGRRPFAGATRYELAAAILGEDPPPLPRRVPARLCAIVTRCLTKDPAQRYPCARTLAAALDDVA